MRRLLPCSVLVGLVVAACGQAGTASTTGAPPETGTTVPGSSSSTAPTACPPVPYRVGELPPGVRTGAVPSQDVQLDEFTSIPGTSSEVWTDDSGRVAVALVRGTLPPRQYPGKKGVVEVAGARGVAGQFEDGTWVVSWYVGSGARCDLYTMVFYQPVDPSAVEASLASVTNG